MASDKPTDPKPKHDLTSRRAFFLAIYIFALVILIKLYWPGWPYSDKPNPQPATPPAASGGQVPQN